MKYALAVMFALLLGVPALAAEDYGCGGGLFGRGCGGGGCNGGGCGPGGCNGGGCGPGGCPSYGPPVYAYPPQRIVYEQPVHHVLLNHGAIQSKFYTKVRFPEGYVTTIPVINGRLPLISVTRSGGRVVRLDLDYQYNYAYGSYGSDGVVHYENFTGTKAATGTHGTIKAPAPRNPNFEQRGAEEPKRVDAPRVDAPTRAPTPRNPNFEDRGSVEAPAPVEKPAPAPTPRRPSDEEIDNLFKNMNTTYGGEQDNLRRPSEIKRQESSKSLSFPRYDR